MSIENNKVIAIEYTVVNSETKEVIDTNVDGEALEFIVGKEQIIPGLESELIKLNLNDSAEIQVEPKDGYGDVDEEAIQTLPREQFADVELKDGMVLYGSGENGETVQVIVQSFNDEEVTIDYNHPLAGKTLMFTVKILDIREATEEELATGIVGGMAQGGCGCGDSSCETEEVQSNSCCGGGNCH
jgi:FKBP-type peptidyl-prolyl cis-trans isomerase SlyD